VGKAALALGGRDEEFRRSVVSWVFLAVIAGGAIYEYTEHRKSTKKSPSVTSDRAAKRAAHLEQQAASKAGAMKFAEELERLKAEHAETETVVDEARSLFEGRYADNARSLLCSGCKLAAAQINDELHERNATEQPDPMALVSATNLAVTAACEHLPSPLVISKSGRGAFFGTFDPADHTLSAIEARKSEMARRSAQTLCKALLSEAKLPMIEALIRHKVPHARYHRSGEAPQDNWERWLCAKRVRLCKRSEVVDDDEDDGGEL